MSFVTLPRRMKCRPQVVAKSRSPAAAPSSCRSPEQAQHQKGALTDSRGSVRLSAFGFAKDPGGGEMAGQSEQDLLGDERPIDTGLEPLQGKQAEEGILPKSPGVSR